MSINVQLKSIKLGTNHSENDHINSTSSFSYPSDYASYPILTSEDLAPVPEPFLSLPVTPPRTPPPTPIATGTASKIDRAFALAALQATHRDMASHVTEAFDGVKDPSLNPKDNGVLLYAMIFIIGVLIGLFFI
uniref:Uncharacterized protein n=1 Tax=Chenopodium quinoa TaxID=63459 RepID=A0A803LUW2_CHEQI